MILLTACSSSEFDNFKKRITEFGEDGLVDEQEMDQLKDIVRKSDNPKFRSLKNGKQVDNSKLCEYVLLIAKRTNTTITEADIFGMVAITSTGPFHVHVFLENSASMDGYLEGQTAFETALFGLLSDVALSDETNGLNLNYINSKVIPIADSATHDEIEYFINKLEPTEFKNRGGDRTTSDLEEAIRVVLDEVDDKNAAIFISDCIFSPGKNKDASVYLSGQENMLKVSFNQAVKRQKDLTALVLQLSSQFKGRYFDQNDTPRRIEAERPYYVWIFASRSNMETIIASEIIEHIKGGYKQKYLFHSEVEQAQKLDCKITRKGRKGEFEVVEGTKITKAEIANSKKSKGKFSFQLYTNLSHPFLSEETLENSEFYTLSDPNYTLSIRKVDPKDRIGVGFSHVMHLETRKLTNESLKIEMHCPPKVPNWVAKSSSDDDTNLWKDDLEKLQLTTFGFNYLFQGIFNGFFHYNNKSTPIFSLTIPISQ